ncbi:MAG: LysR family transcriptional regulator [Burkholderiaceae bacterium]
MNPSLTGVEAFLAVAGQGSFSLAARELGVTQSTISRRIAVLEKQIGERLIERTTRRVALTEGGEAYARELRDALSQLNDAHAKARNRSSEPEGLVRITMPTALGRMRVVPRLARLSARYPKLRFDLDLSDRYVDMLEGSYDVAVRMSDMHRSGLSVEQIGTFGIGLYASEQYGRQYGLPATLDALNAHRVLALRTYSARTEWRAERDGSSLSIKVVPWITATDSLALKTLTLAGAGIAMLPSYLLSDELETGRLIRLLPDLSFASPKVFVVYLTHRRELAKTQVVLDALRHCIDGDRPDDSK